VKAVAKPILTTFHLLTQGSCVLESHSHQISWILRWPTQPPDVVS
jgi:hypothetical protein